MRKGFTLIEFSISLFIVLVGVFGTFTVIQRVSHYSSLNSSKIQAAYLAEEGIEIIRNIRDSNYVRGVDWLEGFPPAGGTSTSLDAGSRRFPDPNCAGKEFLVLNSKSAPYYYTCTADHSKERFQRVILVAPENPLIVYSTVTWEEKGVSQELFIQENFYDWYKSVPD